jgi:surfactin synthase thioesterase subunit
VKLFCLAHAGGSANVYLAWRPHVYGSVELAPVELAGRGRRISEPLRHRFAEVLDDVVAEVTRAGVPGEYALFGHSFGAVVGFELAHVLLARGLPAPRHVFLSSSCSPDRIGDLGFDLSGDDRTLLSSLAHLGGTPDEIVMDDEAVALFAPILRADLRALYDYRYVERMRLPSDVSVLLASHDGLASVDDAARWATLFEGRATTRVLAGGHFTALERPAEVAGWVSGLLTHTGRAQQSAG